MKRGFTLVELSIVLVIIGLLIGGVLAAQSMIETAKTQSFIKQIQQIDAAVENFKTKYNGLPGDSSAFGCNTLAGMGGGHACDDGVITDSLGGIKPQYFDGEIGLFWPSLQQSGYDTSGGAFKTQNSNEDAGVYLSTTIPNKYLPQATLGIKDSTIIALGDNTKGKNYYQVANFVGNADWIDNGIPDASLTPVQALAVDAKMDDGNPNTGTVQAVYAQAHNPDIYLPLPNSGFADYGVTNYCFGANSNVYNISSTAVECSLRIDMLAQSGGQ